MQSKTPTVSVVIPCYNGEAFVGDAIESALNQTYSPIEVIVIDDGSTDGSLDVIRSFGEKIKYESRINSGACVARNRGIKIAKGELIQFLDSDDLLHSEKLAKQVPFAIANKPAITYCDYERHWVDQPDLRRVHSQKCLKKDPVIFIIHSPSLQTSAPLHWKRDLEEFGGFREDLKASQEYDLHLRMACRGAIFKHFPEVLYSVRRMSEGISSDYVKTIQQRLRVLRSAIDWLMRTDRMTASRRMAFVEHLSEIGRKCTERGTQETAKDCYDLARQAHPSAQIYLSHPRTAKRLHRLLGSFVLSKLLSVLDCLTIKNTKTSSA